MDKIDQAICFINQHDPCHAWRGDDGKLHVATDVVYAMPRRVVRVEEVIDPPTKQAVLDWLGY